VLSFYDGGRDKQLSVDRMYSSFSLQRRNVKPIRWLSSNGVLSNVSGFNLLHEAVITGVYFRSEDVSVGIFEINEVMNATVNNVFNLSINSEKTKLESDLNINVQKDWRLEVKLISGEFSFPVVSVKTAWKFSP